MPDPKPTLLIIEDNRAVAVGLDLNLEAEGYRVLLAADGESGLALIHQHKPDLIILDLMLPGIDGFEVLATLRQTDPRTPVIILSARGEEEAKVEGLLTGADDYVTKPFGLKELLARIHVVMRRDRQRNGDSHIIRFGEVQIDSVARAVTREGRTVHLTARELDLLLVLTTRPGRTLSREHLLTAVWGYDYDGTARTVDNFVRALRVKLEEDPAQPRHLVTVHGVGYRFEK